MLPHLGSKLHIWEPAAGSGKMVRALVAAGCTVEASDIADGRDFLRTPAIFNCDVIMTNPPYSRAREFIEHALEVMQPSPVVTLNRAVAASKVRGPEAALQMIEPLADRLSNYFHYFGVRGAFLMQLGRNEEARVAFDRAIALANTSAEAAHIRMHLDRLIRDSQPSGAASTKNKK